MVFKFSVGDPAPWFCCRSTSREQYHFNSVAGRYIVLSFFGTAAHEKQAGILHYTITALRHFFDDHKISFFGVSIDPKDEREGRMKAMLPGIRYLWDTDRRVSALYGAIHDEAHHSEQRVPYHPFTLILDPFLRVLAVIPMRSAEQHNAHLHKLLSALPPIDSYAGVPLHAPVLILPRIFEPKLCRELIRLYQHHGGKESGFMREENGNTVAILDHKFKKRKDFDFNYSEEYNELRTIIQDRFIRRAFPEIYKVFQFETSYIERYTIACYESESGGFFHPHRDDVTKGTAHRRFACTINLNAEEYEGGDLRFPEFGTATYRAPTGGAIIFSCSLLHEATPVTQGTRYAFLPFLYDEAAARIREENQKFIIER